MIRVALYHLGILAGVPGRFAGQRPSRWAYLPFGDGAHKCIGEHLARLEGARVLVRVARRLRFRLLAPDRVEPFGGITLRPRGVSIAGGAALLLTAWAGFSGCGPPEEPDGGAALSERRTSDDLDPGLVDSLSGAPGIFDRESGTYGLALPRSDLLVTADGVRLTPRMGLAGWVVFDPVPGGAVLTAQLPLLADEVDPVISAALLHGLRVTGLHAHFSHEEPRVRFLHLTGIGETDSLAAAVGAILQTLEDVKGQPRISPPPIDPGASTLDPALVDSILGLRGESREGVYRVTIPRSTRFEGYDLGTAAGIATQLTFVGGNDRAATSGHFALVEPELQAVLRALRAGDIQIASIEDPLVGEDPRLVFVHFWGRGRAVDLARSIRDALDAVRRPDGGD